MQLTRQQHQQKSLVTQKLMKVYCTSVMPQAYPEMTTSPKLPMSQRRKSQNNASNTNDTTKLHLQAYARLREEKGDQRPIYEDQLDANEAYLIENTSEETLAKSQRAPDTPSKFQLPSLGSKAQPDKSIDAEPMIAASGYRITPDAQMILTDTQTMIFQTKRATKKSHRERN